MEDPISANIKTSILRSIEVIQEHSTEPDELLTSIKETAQTLCQTIQEFQNRQAAMRNAPEFIEKHNPESLQQFSEMFAEEMKNIKVKTKNEHADFVRLVVGKIDGESSNNTIDDGNNDSIVCTMSTDVQIDPISKGPIKKPCKNTVCKHMYDYDSIQVYIKSRRSGKAPCPYVGCVVKNIRLSDIVLEE